MIQRLFERFPRLGFFVERNKPIGEYFNIVVDTSEDGYPLLGTFNSAFRHYNYKRFYPWCLHVKVELSIFDINETGLPYDSEVRLAHRIEQRQNFNMREILPAKYVGHLFSEGYFHIWWYFRKPNAVKSFALDAEVNQNDVRHLEFQVSFDPEWQQVDPYLSLPTFESTAWQRSV